MPDADRRHLRYDHFAIADGDVGFRLLTLELDGHYFFFLGRPPNRPFRAEDFALRLDLTAPRPAGQKTTMVAFGCRVHAN